MAVRSSIVTVGTDPIRVADDKDTDNRAGRDVVIQNTSSSIVYLGAPDVTPQTGYPIGLGAGIAFSGVQPDSLPHAVVAEGQATLAVLEVGV